MIFTKNLKIIKNTKQIQNKILQDSFTQSLKNQRDLSLKQKIIEEISLKNSQLEEKFSRLEADYEGIKTEKINIETKFQKLKEECEEEKENNLLEIVELTDQVDI